jgi:CDP-diacylglycerol---glycerol-3-phosphate 3-phosphatidyltransferase
MTANPDSRPAGQSRSYTNGTNSVVRLPNGLTALRIIVIPAIVYYLLSDWNYAFLVSALLFMIGAVSDTLDGLVARRQGLVSKFGIFLDLSADKLLISAVLVALVEIHALPAWLTIAIICREFLITGLRTYAAAEGVIVPAGRWGKVKTVVTNLAVFWVIIDADVGRGGFVATLEPSGPIAAFFSLGIWVMYVALALTLLSGLQYLISAAPLMKEEVSKRSPDWHD